MTISVTLFIVCVVIAGVIGAGIGYVAGQWRGF